jgi:hypothetical protein
MGGNEMRMNNVPAQEPSPTAPNPLYQTVVIVNILIMVFPPVYLYLANGNMTWALGYFFISPIIQIASMFFLNSMSGDAAETEAPSQGTARSMKA